MFCRCMKTAAKHFRQQGVRAFNYMDDWAVVETPENVLQVRSQVERTLDKLGLVRHPEKGQWEPSPKLDLLGFTIDLENGTVKAQPKSWAKIERLSEEITTSLRRRGRWIEK